MQERQKRFADYYIALGTVAEAAIKAGYSEKYAKTGAYRLLENVSIKTYIEKRLEAMDAERVADAEEVMKYLTSVMRGESSSEEIVVEGCGDGFSEARAMKKAPSEKDRLKAAELIGKRYMMFTDKVELNADMELNVTIDYGEGGIE